MRLVQQSESKLALGGDTEIGLVLPEDMDASTLFAQLWRRTYAFERQFSRFIAESELSRFNAKAGLKIPVSSEFHALLVTARGLAEQTEGLFNPFVLPAIQRTGYVQSAVEQYAGDPAPDYTERSVVGIDRLELGDDWARIPYGTAIDIGGFGKGYLADQLGAYARAHDVAGYWMNLSGDIAAYGTNTDGSALTIAVQNADSAGQASYLVTCPAAKTCGIATSGTLRRKAHKTNMRGHHIIDPRTGKPAATDIILATVCASSATQADVLASCAVISGGKQAALLLAHQHADAWLLQIKSAAGIQYKHHGKRIAKQKEPARA